VSSDLNEIICRLPHRFGEGDHNFGHAVRFSYKNIAQPAILAFLLEVEFWNFFNNVSIITPQCTVDSHFWNESQNDERTRYVKMKLPLGFTSFPLKCIQYLFVSIHHYIKLYAVKLSE